MNRIGLLLIVAVLSLLRAGDSRAEEEPDLEALEVELSSSDDFEELFMGDIVETVTSAARHEQDIADSPSAISVITREQIENSACLDLACLLQLVPEVDVKRFNPMYISIGARALTDALGDKVLVLVDGQEINSELFGILFWQALPVHLEEIERVEVIRGPGSALYGANAHSMVVTITTRKLGSHAVEVYSAAGEHGSSNLFGQVGQSLGNLTFQLSGSLEDGDHFQIQDKNECAVRRLVLKVDHQVRSTSSYLRLGLQSIMGVMFTALTPIQVSDGWAGNVLLGHKRSWIRSQVSFNWLKTDFALDMPPLSYQGTVLGYPPSGLSLLYSNLDAETQLTISLFEDNLLIAGGNYRWIAIFSDVNVPSESHQQRMGIYLHDEQTLFGRLILTLGTRLDYNSLTATHWAFSPRLALVYQVAKEQRLRLGAGVAYRKPSFMNTSMHVKGFKGTEAFPELEEFFQNSIGNEDLRSESITTVEGGYVGRFLDNQLTAEMVVFYNRYRDTIATMERIVSTAGMPDLGQSSIRFENTGREVDSIGGSLSAGFQYRKSLRLGLNYTLRRSFYVSKPGDLSTDLLEGKEGDPVPWEPTHLANAWIHFLTDAGLRLGLAFHGQSGLDIARPEHGGLFDPIIMIHCPGYFTLSGFAAWRLERAQGFLEAGVKALNLFNASFRDSAAVIRTDGSELGGERIGRVLFLFLRGAI